MTAYINILFIMLVIKYLLNHVTGLSQDKIQKIYLFVSSLILVFFTGLRDRFVGADTVAYGRLFLNFRELDSFSYALSEKTGTTEPLYKAWMYIAGHLYNDVSVNVFFTLTALFVGIFVFILIYKNSKNYFFSIILYYTVGMFNFQMTGLRQSMAMALTLYSLEFIKEKKFFRFILIIAIASLFHTSAWVFLAVYPLARFKINLKNFIIYMSAFGLVMLLSDPIILISREFLGYNDSYDLGTDVTDVMGGATVIGMLLITLILSYIFYKNLIEQSGYNTIFFNITMLSFIVYILRYTVRIAERVSFYFQFAFIILLPNVIEAIPDKKTRKTVYVCAVVLACALFYYRYQMNPRYYGTMWS